MVHNQGPQVGKGHMKFGVYQTTVAGLGGLLLQRPFFVLETCREPTACT